MGSSQRERTLDRRFDWSLANERRSLQVCGTVKGEGRCVLFWFSSSFQLDLHLHLDLHHNRVLLIYINITSTESEHGNFVGNSLA